jgi:hypothetical protein
LELSAQLLELTPKQRALHLPQIMDKIIENDHQVVILDNLELLFDVQMKQDPFRLLQRISRNHLVIASWNGSSKDGKLMYAETGHPEYRSYDLADTLIVKIENSNN